MVVLIKHSCRGRGGGGGGGPRGELTEIKWNFTKTSQTLEKITFVKNNPNLLYKMSIAKKNGKFVSGFPLSWVNLGVTKFLLKK